jgi:hypothetical protein
MRRTILSAALALAMSGAAHAALTQGNPEPGIESARVWIAPIVPCETDSQCEVKSGAFVRWLERDPELRSPEEADRLGY